MGESSTTIQKVSHTLKTATANRLQNLAFYGHVSESAVVEAALEDFFNKGTDDELHAELSRRGFRRRRRPTSGLLDQYDSSKVPKA